MFLCQICVDQKIYLLTIGAKFSQCHNKLISKEDSRDCSVYFVLDLNKHKMIYNYEFYLL